MRVNPSADGGGLVAGRVRGKPLRSRFEQRRGVVAGRVQGNTPPLAFGATEGQAEMGGCQ